MAARVLKGIPVSPGVAVGRLRAAEGDSGSFAGSPSAVADVGREVARLREAFAEVEAELDRLRQALEGRNAQREAMIFHAQRTIVQDPGARAEVEREIATDGASAEVAVRRLLDRYERTIARIDTPLSQDQAADFRDPWKMVLAVLSRRAREEALAGAEPFVLYAEDLAPSLAAWIARDRVLAIVAARGGRFSHGAVLARSFGVPTVSGVSDRRLRDGAQVVVNGDDGSVLVEPTPEEVDLHERRARERIALRAALASRAREPALTADGERIEIGANVESLRDLDGFDLETVDGVGLLRTEFLYLERREFPSEDEQTAIYRRVLERLEGRPVVFRTLDVGGDKPLPYLRTPPERNPVLGWRGLRLLLEWRDLFLVQLRAILRASAHGKARLLLPMVTRLEEVRAVRSLLNEVQSDLERAGVRFDRALPLGVMVEIPSVALSLDAIAREVDFVSLGTNDLVQYALAVDRDNPWVARLYEPYDPGVLRLLDAATKAALAAGKPISVCGEFAGDPAAALLLVGMGIRSLSMSPVFVAEVKAALRGITSAEAERLRDEAVSKPTADEVRECVLARWNQVWKKETERYARAAREIPAREEAGR